MSLLDQLDPAEVLQKGVVLVEDPHRRGVLLAVPQPKFYAVVVDLINAFEETRRGDYIEVAIDSFRFAVRGISPESPYWSDWQDGLGHALVSRYERAGDPGDLNEAIAAFKSIEDAGVGAGRADWQNRLGLALVYRYEAVGDVNDLKEAVAVLRGAITQTPPGDPLWTVLQGNLGLAFNYLFEASGNEEDLRAGLDAVRDGCSAVPTGEPLWITFQYNLALFLQKKYQLTWNLSDLNEAIKAVESILAVVPRDSGEWLKYRAHLAIFLHSRFIASSRVQDLTASIEALREALAASSETDREYANWKNNLGVALRTRFEASGELGDLEEAQAACREALQLSIPGSPNWQNRLYNIGLILINRFDTREERDDIDAALDAFKQVEAAADERTPMWAVANAYIGVILRKRFEHFRDDPDLANAITSLRKALTAVAEDSINWVHWCANLGGALTLRYTRERRRSDLNEAVDMFNKVCASATPGFTNRARYLTDLGTALRYRHEASGDVNDLNKAVSAYRGALTLHSPEVRPDDVSGAARALGDLYFSRAEWEEAANVLLLGVQASNILQKTQSLGREKQVWLNQAGDIYRRAAYALAMVGRLREAVMVLEEGKARGLSEALARDRADLSRMRDDRPEIYTAYENAIARLHYLEAREQAGGVAAAAGARPLTPEAIREEAREARAELDEVVKKIRLAPGYEDFLSEPDFDDVIAAVEPDAPLVYLLTTTAGSLALVVTATEIIAVRIDFTQDEVNALLLKYEGGEIVGGYLPGQLLDRAALSSSLAEALPLLGERLIAPVAERLRALGVKQIRLIASERLMLFPFHATYYVVGGKPVYFMDEFAVSYVPNARLLVVGRKEAQRRTGARHFVGVGNPLPHSVPLRAAQVEVEEVSPLFPEEERTALYAEAATKESVLELIPRATHLHFACHGFFNYETPLDSRLELAGEHSITLREILYEEAKPLKATLVVLSACQSAVSDFLYLPDEFIGLPSGFLQAGVPGVVGTLWSVDDITTALIMIKFYEFYLEGDPSHAEPPMPAARALQRAQSWLREARAGTLLEYFLEHKRLNDAREKEERARMSQQIAAEGVIRFSLEDEDSQPFADEPYYWAAFVFAGV